MERGLIPVGTAKLFSRRATQAILLGVASLTAAALLAASAQAALGVVTVSHGDGVPGEQITLTLGCDFCYPPCKGPKGERHPEGFERGPCMFGTHGAEPPPSFGISLVPLEKAPRPHRCGPNALCPPQASAPPFRYLGLAIPPPQGNNPENGTLPQYLLRFRIPDFAPGLYTYVIYCDVCVKGRGGTLIANPRASLWRLRVNAEKPPAPGVSSALF